MPKITQKQKVELTRWFKPGNYLALKDLTLWELYYEFVLRREMHERYQEAAESPDAEWLLPDVNKSQEKLIFGGNPILIKNVNFIESEDLLDDFHVKPLTVKRVNLLIRNIKKVAGVQSDKHNTLAPEQTDMLEMSFTRFNLESLTKGAEKSANTGRENDPVLKNMWERRIKKAKGQIYLQIDLGTSTDSQIVSSITHLLPQWRKVMEVESPKLPSYGFGEVMIQKLINFNVIPMLDLMYFAKRNRFKYSDKDIEQLLYPWGVENPRDYVQIRETDRPMAERALLDEFDNLFTAFMYKKTGYIHKTINEILHDIAVQQAAARGDSNTTIG